MKSILIERPGRFEIIDQPKPQAADDELLIQIKALSLCNQHDWKVNKGLYKDLVYLEYGVPGFPGHEGAGIVVDKGSAVTGFNIGDHVVMSGLGGPPLYCEFVTRKQDSVARAPVNVPFEHLAMSELLGCVHRACCKVPQMAGKSVLVSGCGPAGLAAVQICKAFSCTSCLAVDVDSERLLLAERLGADATINARDAAAMERGSREGVDMVIECSGNHQALQQAFYFAREAVVIFSYSEGVLPVPSWPLFDHELTIYNSKWLTNQDLQSVVDMVAAEKIRTAEMISVVTDFDHYPDLVERIGRGEIIKAVMIP